jgi:hypothetical protein
MSPTRPAPGSRRWVHRRLASHRRPCSPERRGGLHHRLPRDRHRRRLRSPGRAQGPRAHCDPGARGWERRPGTCARRRGESVASACASQHIVRTGEAMRIYALSTAQAEGRDGGHPPSARGRDGAARPSQRRRRPGSRRRCARCASRRSSRHPPALARAPTGTTLSTDPRPESRQA